MTECHLPSMTISIHALREEGDPPTKAGDRLARYFYPRPPRGGRPPGRMPPPLFWAISIHALREEGDIQSAIGGSTDALFLSTPSARRATAATSAMPRMCVYFYPRPPRGGRLVLPCTGGPVQDISIHALREEGDPTRRSPSRRRMYFYPRPPRGGRQRAQADHREAVQISIHALREEGDEDPQPPPVL